MTVRGDRQVKKILKRLRKQAPRALLRALYEEAAKIFEASQLEVPVKDGFLRGSGLLGVTRDASHRLGPAVVVAYGKSYALRVHENTKADARRKARAANARRGGEPVGAQLGKSKYLEDPFQRAAFGMLPRVARRTKVLIARGNSPDTQPTVKGRRG
jgi:hypothetical protein